MLRNPQPGRVRLLIRCNIGFAVIIVCIFVQTVFTCNLPTFKCILWEEQSDFL
jgi:hypothetical protein